MAKSITLSAKLFFSFFFMGILFIACGNNATEKSKGDNDSADRSRSSITSLDDGSTPDHSMVMTSDTANSMTATNTSTTNTMTAGAGTAKPNPAKKGLKGKVIVKPEIANKTAKMEADASGVYSNAEVMASFPNGTPGLQSYFDKYMQYPAQATNEGVEGTVNVMFVVDENGKLISPQVTGGNLGYGLEEEALRVIKRMPAWTPAKVKGKNVKTRITLPIRFQLI